MSAINVALHPVAQRHGAASATDVAYTLPAEAAPAAAQPLSPHPARSAASRASEPSVHAPVPAGAPGSARASDPGPSAAFAPASAPFQHNSPLESFESHQQPIAEHEHPSWGLLHSDLDVYPPIRVPAACYEPAQSATPTRASSRAPPGRAPRRQPVLGSASLAPPLQLAEEGMPPVRRMTAEQYADMYARYASLDVPHAVVFPFLHGVDGDNVPQNLFFGAPVSGMPTPNYRGLTVVRADMPCPGDRIYTPSTSSSWTVTKSPSAASSPSASSPGLADSPPSPGSPSSMSAAGPCLDEHPSTHLGKSPSAKRASCDDESVEGSPSALPRSSLSSQHSSLLTGSTADLESSAATSVASSSAASCCEDEHGATKALGDRVGEEVRTMDPNAAPLDPQPGHSILASTVFPSDLLAFPSSPGAGTGGPTAYSSTTAPSFLRPRQSSGVSLRNFRIQSVKYATISDIVIYSPAGLHDGALKLAACFRHAQEELYQERLSRGLGSLRYNVFVVEDPFDVFQQNFPELVAVNSSGKSTNRVDFVDGEREEMEILTRASQLDTNVWIGSNGDLPAPEVDMPSSDWTNVDAAPRTNPNNYAVCIEAHETGEMPSLDKLQGAAQYMDSLQVSYHTAYRSSELLSSTTGTAWPTSEGSSGASAGSLGLSLGPRGWSTSPSSTHALMPTEAYSPPAARATGAALAPVPVPLASIVLMECAVTASDRAFGGPGLAHQFADQMIELAIWIKEQADPCAFPHRAGRMLPRKVLLHCADGYTETSVLAITYIMYTHPGMRLPEAYLFLQNNLQRSFFVYPREVPMLQLIEARLRAHKWPKFLTPPFDPHNIPSSPSPSPQKETSFPRTVDDPTRHSWFYDSLFEGSFPSRILDFLYLGNLNQAMNAGMLRALGITHVVSVGESALSAPPGMDSATPFAAGKEPGARVDTRAVPPTGTGGRWPSNSLWAEREAGRISVLHVQGVADDGIDPLRSSMKQAVEYIEAARRAGGKVLVHCRVGVSRSSTIVLAYVMAHLDLSLIEAYLLVRSRRLNILIQPHLLFFWELRGWESYLSRQRVKHLLAHSREEDLMDLDDEIATDTWVALTRAHVRTHGLSSNPSCRYGPEARLTVLPECQQYRRQIKSASRTAGKDGILVARPSATGGAVLEEVHTLDEEDPLDCDLGVGTSSIRANLPAPLPLHSSHTAYTPCSSGMERASTVVAGLPTPATTKTLCPPCSCGYGHASVGHGTSRGVHPRAMRLVWGSFAQEVAHLNERYFV